MKLERSNFKLYFILLAIGFILIVLDVDVKTCIPYPKEYANTNSVTGEFQYYNIASLYGGTCTYKLIDTSPTNDTAHNSTLEQSTSAQVITETKVIDKVFFDNIHIDIFNDFIGFILILYACVKLGVANKRFRLAAFSAFCGIVLHAVLVSLPFIINGLSLCTAGMLIGMVYLACNVLTVFLFTSGLFLMCPQICCRDERKWGKITWFIAFTLQILVTFVFWLGSDFGMLYTVGILFDVILIMDIIGFWMILRRVIPYMENTYLEALETKNS